MHRNRLHAGEALLQLLRDLERARLRFDDRQVAVVIADTAHQTFEDFGGVIRQAPEKRFLHETSDPAVRDVRHNQRLRGADANVPRPVAIGKFCHEQQIFPGDSAHRDFEPHIIQPRLLLPKDPRMIVLPKLSRIHPRAHERALKARLQLVTKPRLSPFID